MPVAEAEELGQQVEADVKEGIEASDPQENDWRRQLEDAFDEGDVVATLPRFLRARVSCCCG